MSGVDLGPSTTSGEFVVMGIDPGKSSGVCILRPNGTLVDLAEIRERDAAGRQAAIRLAVGESYHLGVDLVIVRETWTAGGRRANPKTFAGLGAQAGRWLESIDTVARSLPASRIFESFFWI